MVSYNTNWMGPVSLNWTEKNGNDWCVGRIDVYGTGSDYPEELHLPTMKSDDWYRFSSWLDTIKTVEMLTTEQLVDWYETETGWRITWYENQ